MSTSIVESLHNIPAKNHQLPMTLKQPSLQPGFRLEVASPDDMPEIWQVYAAAFEEDEVWPGLFRDVVNPAEIYPWICTNFAPRLNFPDIITYKITEDASGAIAGWTALQIPWKYLHPSVMTDELKAQVTKKELPPPLPGMDVESLADAYRTMGGSKLYGYDPENDYHRRGTMIRPDMQRKGFGSFLTQYCNQIVDHTGDRLWTRSRPSSQKMFRQNEFVEVGRLDSHHERWGGTREKSITYILLHSPPCVSMGKDPMI
ncbi:BgTH12-00621 [Blumeria graminis f. sp. triticale]|uniref:BgTH12-00621 n=1 Tax=Blumeria graminis f. sp. triticale TaxID=1689686 RepID=A0A9W4D6S4_BLUGR|nr:BgTH12-00621 [Blumeria graminis f. sp. triticale]